MIANFGITDVKGCKNGVYLKSFITWKDMIKRVYNPVDLKRKPTYKGCSVHPDWSLYSNFKMWHDSHYIEGYQLDKDILQPGNRIYGPDTCAYVPCELNSLQRTTTRKRANGLPTGVHLTKNNTYKVVFSGKYITTCDTIDEATKAYLETKLSVLKNKAEGYHNQNALDKRVFNTIMNYTTEDLL